MHPVVRDIKFGFELARTETVRWSRQKREERLCDTCQVVGDENHYLFSCIRLERSDSNLSGEVKEMWDHPAIFKLVYLLKSLELL